eukprot:1343278-Amorphochlora_amoeboformis.AAC.3
MGREADMVAGPVGTTDPSTLTVKRKSFLTMGNTATINSIKCEFMVVDFLLPAQALAFARQRDAHA